MKTVLVTGGRGFIGKHLCDYLDGLGHHVIVADQSLGFDLTDSNDAKMLPDVDLVIHLAAVNGTKHFYEKPLDVLRNNLLSTQAIIDRYAGKVERIVFSGSCESYSGAVDTFSYPVPTPETVPLVINDVNNPRWSYAGSKIANELQIIAAKHQLNQDFTIIRYHNVYGPGQVDHFIPEFYYRAKSGNLTLNGWKNTRSFIYISDAVKATADIAFNNRCINEVINVGADDERTIKDVAKIILEEAGINGDLILNDAPEGSVSRRCPDLTKLKTLTNFKPSISLREGIDITIKSL